MGDATVGVVPQLGACGFVVNAGVVAVGKLVQHAAFAFGLHALSQITGVLHATALGCQDQLSTKRLHGLGAFDGQVLRHDQHHAVALDGRGHGQCNARVARGGLNQGVARLDIAALLGTLNHRQRWAVFHRTGGVVTFQLAQNHVAALGIFCRTNALQCDQGRLTNCVFNGWVNCV